jgi:hypothetical protein
MKFVMFALILSAVVSCSDATKGAYKSLGESRHVVCYSGGVKIYEGDSTGKIENEAQSDGLYFSDKNGMFVEMNADCVITNKN